MRINSFLVVSGIALTSTIAFLTYQHYNKEDFKTFDSGFERPIRTRPTISREFRYIASEAAYSTTNFFGMPTEESLPLIANPQIAADYFQNGNYYLENQQYKEALAAYEKAEKLKFDNKLALYYQMAAAETQHLSALDSKSDAHWDTKDAISNYLDKAHQNGFNDYHLLLTDEKLAAYRAEPYGFTSTFSNMFSENKSAMFACFVSLCPNSNAQLPYSLDAKAIFANLNYKEKEANGYYQQHPSISGDFENFVPGAGEAEFSRDGGDNYNFESLLETNPSIIALIYSVESPWGDFVNPKTYHLATYTTGGKKIANVKIASRSEIGCTTAQISADGTIVTQEYSVTWKTSDKNSDTVSSTDIKNITPKGKTKVYNLTEDGKIQPAKLPIGML